MKWSKASQRPRLTIPATVHSATQENVFSSLQLHPAADCRRQDGHVAKRATTDRHVCTPTSFILKESSRKQTNEKKKTPSTSDAVDHYGILCRRYESVLFFSLVSRGRFTPLVNPPCRRRLSKQFMKISDSCQIFQTRQKKKVFFCVT